MSIIQNIFLMSNKEKGYVKTKSNEMMKAF